MTARTSPLLREPSRAVSLDAARWLTRIDCGIVMSRLHERLERERDDWVLGPDARAALLDGWVHRDVAHADAILAELGRRVAG